MQLAPFSMTSSISLLLFLTVSLTKCSVGLKDPRLPVTFYPFGTDEGDSVVLPNDDGYTPPVQITIGFPFFNSTRTSIYVNTNGALSFDAGVSSFTPNPFPVYSASMVAAYWCDVDTRINSGRVYYRETTDASLLARASRDIQAGFTPQGFYYFQAQWIFIATWHNVTYYGGSRTTPIQSFQAVMATDGIHSFAMFNYGELVWTSGTASGGSSTTGLGGTPAQVGFNAGDASNFYAVPWSRTPQILNIARTSNIGTNGRWAFRVDNSRITPPGCGKATATECSAWQQTTASGNCSDIAPQFDCPVVSGPTVISRQTVEFYCTVPTNVTDPMARFEVTFTFDGAILADVPLFTVNALQPRATLHERYLHGKLGKWISCKVVSYWTNSTALRSRQVTSINGYRAAIDTSSYSFVVTEYDPQPYRLTLRSTLPITCQRVDGSGLPTSCLITLAVSTTTDIAVRQRYPGLGSTSCSYVITESDWNALESVAYSWNGSLEVTSKVDVFVTRPRLNTISFSLPTLPDKTVNGETYPNPWSGYQIKPAVLVFHIDAQPSTQYVTCSSSGDPRISTFDNFYYSTYATGQFVYARSVYGLPFEVQVRHWPCSNAVSCVCGVAIREDDTIIIADMCKDRVVHYLTFNGDGLPAGAGVTTTSGGYSFKLQMPTGNKVVGSVMTWGMNIVISMAGKIVSEGLCGYHDFNRTNDLKIRNSTQVATLTNSQPPAAFIESWRVPLGWSLFDGFLAVLSRGDAAAETPSTYCQCSATPVCGGPAVTDNSTSTWEPNVVVPPKVPGNSNGNNGNRVRRSVDSNDVPTTNIDYSYSESNFTENSNNIVTLQWPTSTGITQAQAEDGCRSRIFTNNTIGPECFRSLSAANVTSIVQKCVDDVQVSGDFSFALDKIAELQRHCINLIVTRNYTDINDTAALMRAVRSDVRAVTAFTCEPADCSGHGSCSNGTCVCTADYIGTDCAVSRSAIPSIDRLLDSVDCDVRTQSCQSVSMVTTNAATTVSCKVEISKGDARTQYTATARKTSPNTVACLLPAEPLGWFSNRVNFTALHGPGFEFNNLPLGGAVMVYTVAISNDGQRFSGPLKLRLIDTLCMVNGPGCVQKPNTCVIHGYCFNALETNPYASCLVCKPSSRVDGWTSTDASSCPAPDAETFVCPGSASEKSSANSNMLSVELSAVRASIVLATVVVFLFESLLVTV